MEAWQFRESADGFSEEFPRGNGWYDCELTEVKQIMLPTNPAYWDVKKMGPMPEKQAKVLFIFMYDGIYEAAKMCTPTMSKKGRMLPFLEAMHGQPLPEDVLKSPTNFQAFAMSLVGGKWSVKVVRGKSGKRNSVDAVGPRATGVVPVAPAPQPLKEGDSDISVWDPRGANLPGKYLYTFNGMDPSKVAKAEALLVAAGGVKDSSRMGWVTTTQVPALKKYEVDLDEAPF